MKSYQVTYSKGHLVDVETQKRIFLKRNGTFSILGDDNQFEERDELTSGYEPLDDDAKLEELKQEHKRHLLVKIAKRGTKLIYRIGLSKKHSSEENQAFLFNAVLLEDLYMMTPKNNPDKGKGWQLCKCICETTDCLDGDMQLIESIRGRSLNNLYSNMVAFYFPLQRSGVCNAFKTFYLATKDDHKLGDILTDFFQDSFSKPLDRIEDLRMRTLEKLYQDSSRLFK